MAHYTVNCSRFESWRDVRFSTIIRPNGREDDFQHGYPCAFRRETNSAKSSAKSPAVRPGLPSFLACPHARKHSATRQNTSDSPRAPAELGGKRGTIKGSKAPRLFRQRGFELP